jgi:hypothetical protein
VFREHTWECGPASPITKIALPYVPHEMNEHLQLDEEGVPNVLRAFVWRSGMEGPLTGEYSLKWHKDGSDGSTIFAVVTSLMLSPGGHEAHCEVRIGTRADANVPTLDSEYATLYIAHNDMYILAGSFIPHAVMPLTHGCTRYAHVMFLEGRPRRRRRYKQEWQETVSLTSPLSPVSLRFALALSLSLSLSLAHCHFSRSRSNAPSPEPAEPTQPPPRVLGYHVAGVAPQRAC